MLLRSFFFCAMLVLLACGRARPEPVPSDESPRWRGLAVPLYAWEPDNDYGPELREIADLGANAVSLFVVQMMDNGSSTDIYPVERRTAPDETLRRTIRQARAEGLRVMLLPIVLLENPREKDWRGNIKPQPLETWFANYTSMLTHYAAIAEEEGVEWLTIGSEFSSMEKHTEEWQRVIAAARETFGGRLLYSCNWDHLHGPEGWWQDLDAIGLSSYYELTKDNNAPQEELDAAWKEVRADVLEWRAEAGLEDKPLIFTEVGYPSIDGGAVYPWDYTRKSDPDLNEQRMALEAFLKTWTGEPAVEGIFYYKWSDFGEDDERGYSPKGKPAEETLRAWMNRSGMQP